MTEHWARRRWPLHKAIDQHAWDLDSILTLSRLLGADLETEPVTLRWQEEITEARQTFNWLDSLLRQEAGHQTRLFTDDATCLAVCWSWLSLDVRFRPDQRRRLLDLKIALILIAERQDIDLRGMGV